MKPDFPTLPEVQPSKTHRYVGTTMMDEEQYRVEGWTQDAKGYWHATLAGLQEYGRLIAARREARIAEAIGRREAADSWSAEVERMIERTP